MQVLAGTGLNPRRMSNHLSDCDRVLDEQGRFNLVFSAIAPAAELAGAQWIKIPRRRDLDRGARHIADPASAIPAQLEISCSETVRPQRR